MHQAVKLVRRVSAAIKRILTRGRNEPGDPHAYARVRNKPRLPHRSAAAVAEWPE
jgi:hypothetical protein